MTRKERKETTEAEAKQATADKKSRKKRGRNQTVIEGMASPLQPKSLVLGPAADHLCNVSAVSHVSLAHPSPRSAGVVAMQQDC